jgi:hypothetical protein
MLTINEMGDFVGGNETLLQLMFGHDNVSACVKNWVGYVAHFGAW